MPDDRRTPNPLAAPKAAPTRPHAPQVPKPPFHNSKSPGALTPPARQLIKPLRADAQGPAPHAPAKNHAAKPTAVALPKPTPAPRAVQLKAAPKASPPTPQPPGVIQLARFTRTQARNAARRRYGIDQGNIVRPRRDYLGNPLNVNARGRVVRLRVRVARYAPGAPAGYHEVPRNLGHNNMIGLVWVRYNPVRLWWKNPRRQVDNFVYQGSRALDRAYCDANYEAAAGYTWHHCADYAGGVGTMQLVPTAEHASWGHWGGVEQARAQGVPGY